MQLRMPSYPLITADPYFSVWSPGDTLNGQPTEHWTGLVQPLEGTVLVDDQPYAFMGTPGADPIPQISVDMTPLSTIYHFGLNGFELTASFTTPKVPDDLMLVSWPVSYLEISANQDCEILLRAGKAHVTPGDEPVKSEVVGSRYPMIRIGCTEQPVLKRFGDQITIDYGYLYLTCGESDASVNGDDQGIGLKTAVQAHHPVLIVFGYDDVASIQYFGENCRSLWNQHGEPLSQVMETAIETFPHVKAVCDAWDQKIEQDALEAGGRTYAEILCGAFRQAFGSHKLVLDPEGKLLWVSKECNSGGYACTVDVTFPSAPVFLLYAPELLKALVRPVIEYAESDRWPYDFAPHDLGRYPLLNGQQYSTRDGVLFEENQMPVEECGNLLILVSALKLLCGDDELFEAHRKILTQWVDYLVRVGYDPANQLCTDDFAGHLAHNMNLSLKAICAIAAFGKVAGGESGSGYIQTAKHMAERWIGTKRNPQGSYPLTFDHPDSFSMKYNLIWDQLLGLGLFPEEILEAEVRGNVENFHHYGLPLDSRHAYTKADWLIWTASLIDDPEVFEQYLRPLWHAYHETPDRVPMTDWYDTDTAAHINFRNRTVVGGYWITVLKKG